MLTILLLAVVAVYATLAMFAWGLCLAAGGPTPVPTPRPTLGVRAEDVPQREAA